MKNVFEFINVLISKQKLEEKLNLMIYGSAEIREKGGKKYIYVHYRDAGVSTTKYVGEYTDELYNLILNNNAEVKKIKKEIKTLEKKLKELGYNFPGLSDKVKLNIDFAKRNMVSTIYDQAILEGVATTFVDTENIIEGGKVNNMTSDDIMKIVNLKHAWEFVLNENVILSPDNFALLSQINKLVIEGFYYNAGVVRSTPVKIGGTSWSPSIPVQSEIISELERLLNGNLSGVDLAIELLLYVMKRQIFIDGNKRTAVLFANHYLIANGLGIIAIPADLTNEYKKLLISYYEDKDESNIKSFLKEKCYIALE